MKLFNAINIQNEIATVLSIKKKRNTYEVLGKKHFKLSELKDYLESKKNYYVSINQEDILNENISIPATVKKDNIIKSLILHKFKDDIEGKEILLNYHELSTNNHTKLYHVDGVYEEEYEYILGKLGKQNEIKSTAASRFALFGLSEQCIKEESYLSVYTQENEVDILVVHKGVPIFNRASTVMSKDEKNRHFAIANEISSTITYIKQQFHTIRFSTIALSGSVAMDEVVPEHIYILTQIPITVLYPNTFITGLPNEKIQNSILALGSYFVPKSCQFLPRSLIRIRQFLFSQNILLMASAIIFIAVFFFTYSKYMHYTKSLEVYEAIKNQLIQTVKNTKTYSQKDLQQSINYLEVVEKYLYHHPADQFPVLKPLILLQKPDHMSWKYRKGQPELSLSFTKLFDNLDGLHKFEKTFNAYLKKISAVLPLTFIDKTNYEKMQFNGIINIAKVKKIPQRHRRRRR